MHQPVTVVLDPQSQLLKLPVTPSTQVLEVIVRLLLRKLDSPNCFRVPSLAGESNSATQVSLVE